MSTPVSSSVTLAHRQWWTWVVAFVVVVGSWGSNHRLQEDRPLVRLAALLAAMAILPLLLGASHHYSLLFSGLCSGLYFAGRFADGPIYLALPAVTLVYALALPPRRWVPWAAVAAGLAVAGIGWRAYLDDDPGDLWQGAGFLALVAAAGAVGAALRSRREATAERIGRTATEERLRMAQDLHDGVGHGLAVIAMQAGVALHVFDSDPAKARASLEAIRTTSRESLDALRFELAAMSGTTVAEGAPRRPSPGLADLPALLDRVRAAGLRVDLVGAPVAVPESVGEVGYAIVQESLTNVLRHADASTATVALDRTAGGLVVAVSDDGRGAPVGGGPGMGMSGMRARVEAAGGRFSSGPGAAGGFTVRAEVPLVPPARHEGAS